MKTLYLVGNEAISFDNAPFAWKHILLEKFPDLQVIEVDPNENFFPEADALILDTVQGIETMQIYTSLDTFADHAMVSPHDYDLLFHLQLLKKIGKLPALTIVGLPMGKKVEEKEFIGFMSKLLSKNA